MVRICGRCLILLSIVSMVSVNLAFADREWEIMGEDAMSNIVAFGDIVFLDPDNAWGLVHSGEQRYIARTTDGWKTWKTVYTIDGIPYDIFFLDDKRLWVSGRNGLLLHTEDGGVNWQRRNVNVGEDIREIYFTDANRGWLVTAIGEREEIVGMIYHTQDGGVTWTKQYEARRGLSFTEVYFVNADEGWVLGYSDGVILHTEDGGRTWEEQESGVEGRNPLRSIR